jgi:hypothetical protein
MSNVVNFSKREMHRENNADFKLIAKRKKESNKVNSNSFSDIELTNYLDIVCDRELSDIFSSLNIN